MRIIIQDFPFPPSSNQIYGSFFDQKKKRMRHYSTGKLKKYEKDCEAWAMVNWNALRGVRRSLQEAIKDQRTMIGVSSYFIFNQSNIWTSNGRIQTNDTSNRLKAQHDQLAKHLEIDDKYFNVKCAEKIWVHDNQKEKVVLVLTLEKIRSLDELMVSLLPSKDVPEAKTNC